MRRRWRESHLQRGCGRRIGSASRSLEGLFAGSFRQQRDEARLVLLDRRQPARDGLFARHLDGSGSRQRERYSCRHRFSADCRRGHLSTEKRSSGLASTNPPEGTKPTRFSAHPFTRCCSAWWVWWVKVGFGRPTAAGLSVWTTQVCEPVRIVPRANQRPLRRLSTCRSIHLPRMRRLIVPRSLAISSMASCRANTPVVCVASPADGFCNRRRRDPKQLSQAQRIAPSFAVSGSCSKARFVASRGSQKRAGQRLRELRNPYDWLPNQIIPIFKRSSTPFGKAMAARQ
jgi:hypothetical protein